MKKFSKCFFVDCNVIDNPETNAQKSIYEWGKIIEEQGNMHCGFQNTPKSQTFNLLFQILKHLINPARIKKWKQ